MDYSTAAQVIPLLLVAGLFDRRGPLGLDGYQVDAWRHDFLRRLTGAYMVALWLCAAAAVAMALYLSGGESEARWWQTTIVSAGLAFPGWFLVAPGVLWGIGWTHGKNWDHESEAQTRRIVALVEAMWALSVATVAITALVTAL